MSAARSIPGAPIILSALLCATPALAEAPECLPSVGLLMPLRQDLVAQIGVLDVRFERDRHDAEFRGCDEAAGCEIAIHKRTRGPSGAWTTAPFEVRGFGERIELPRDELTATVIVPPCIRSVPTPPPEPRKVKPRRPKRPVPKPAPVQPPEQPPVPAFDDDPEVIAAARMMAAPTVGRLIENGMDPDAPPGMPTPGPTPIFRLPPPGELSRIGSRVEVEVAEDGQVTFHSSTVSVDTMPMASADDGGELPPGAPIFMSPVGVRGEGLNALDGVDIDAPLKRAFMEATREARYAMYVDHRQQMMSLALFRMSDRLASLRDAPGLDPAARRSAIFALWAEATNESEPGTDPAFVSAGAEARAYVESFVRRAWAPDAIGMTPAEIVELHRAAGWSPGQPVFDPYGTGAIETALAETPPSDKRRVDAGLRP